MILTQNTISQLAGKRVLLRADLNVPLDHIEDQTNDFRLQALLPTLAMLINAHCKIILITHCGRPKLVDYPHYYGPHDEELSTARLLPWFKTEGYEVEHEVDLVRAQEKSHSSYEKILLIENMRYFKGEQESNLDFARILKQLADYYINDAFGLIHRHDCSVTLLAQQFKPDHRYAGLLMDKECRALDTLKKNIQRPYVLVLGGKKVTDKLSWLEKIVSQENKNLRPDTVLIGGMLANTFFKAQSPIEHHDADSAQAQTIMTHCEQNNITLHVPRDIITGYENTGLDAPFIPNDEEYDYDLPTCAGNLALQPLEQRDIGKKTASLYAKIIKNARTVIIAGTMGQYERDYAAQGTEKILQAVATGPGFSVVGGGDTVNALKLFTKSDSINVISTGGGALLAYLATSDPRRTYEALKLLEEE